MMFLHQKLEYNLKIVKTVQQMEDFFAEFRENPTPLIAYDTETTGLNIGLDKPFLVSIGYRKNIAVFEPKRDLLRVFFRYAELAKYLVAHNAKYDYHMLNNMCIEYGLAMPSKVRYLDTIHVARLTEFSDIKQGFSLEALGKKYVEHNAKFGSDFIREGMIYLRKQYKEIGKRLFNDGEIGITELSIKLDEAETEVLAENEVNFLKAAEIREKAALRIAEDREFLDLYNNGSKVSDYLKDPKGDNENIKGLREFTGMTFTKFFNVIKNVDIWDKEGYLEREMEQAMLLDRKRTLKLVDAFMLLFSEPNYEDVYKLDRQLMINYAADDVVILLEYLRKVWKALNVVDPDLKITNIECDLLPVSARAERAGIYVDVPYLIESKKVLENYIEEKYQYLRELGFHYTVNQHAAIKDFFDEHKAGLDNVQQATLTNIRKLLPDDLPNRDKLCEIGELIANLRSVEKSLSTSIIGKLNQQVDGIIYLDTNNCGTITGRVSNDMQQYPSGETRGIDGEVLFSPRRMIIPPKDHHIVSIDYAQMEIRVQAQYTIDIGKPDITMLQAVMPYGYVHAETGLPYDKNFDNIDDTWVHPETGEKWHSIDLHGAMARNAFPHIDPEKPEFRSKYREMAKRANFLIIYGGGAPALVNSIGISYEDANSLIDGFNKTFPNVREYQKWAEQELKVKRYVANFMGRRYYLQEPSSNSYKAFNYLIQGGAAYAFKERQIMLDFYLRSNNLKSRMVMPIHDEMIYYVHKDELNIIPDLRAIMEDISVCKDVPLLTDVEISDVSWADLNDYKIERKDIGDVKFGI